MSTIAKRRTALIVLTALVLAGTSTAANAAGNPAPADRIDLPDGFGPEGITIDDAGVAYLGSLADGDILAVDLANGKSRTVREGAGPEKPSVGMKVDDSGRLFVAGGPSGTGSVVDTATGALLRSYTFTTEPSFINDVVLTKYAAWFTDSTNARIYGVPLLPFRGTPAKRFVTLPLRGDWVQTAGMSANGIASTPDGKALLVVQTETGQLFRVNQLTGIARQVDLGGYSLSDGDGILLEGNRLFVVRNALQQVAVIDLNRTGTWGRVASTLTSSEFDVPTAVASSNDSLYLPNARFTTALTPTTEYWITRLDKP